MKSAILFGSLLFATALQATPVSLNVYTYKADVTKRLLKQPTGGYARWRELGWIEYFDNYLNPDKGFRARHSLGKCSKADYDPFQATDCMVAATVHSMEKSVKELGLNVKLNYKLHYSDFKGADLECRGNCIRTVNFDWKQSGADIDVLLLPKAKGSQGFTRTLSGNKAISSLVWGVGLPFQILHLFRHELGHAFGVNGHLYGNEFVFNKDRKKFPKCRQRLIKPYAKSGIKKSCANDTFLGTWIPKGKICFNRWAGVDSGYFKTKWSVPVYGTDFNYVFGCYLSALGSESPKPEPKPDPKPTPKPKPENGHKYCPNWLGLIERYNCKK